MRYLIRRLAWSLVSTLLTMWARWPEVRAARARRKAEEAANATRR
jgi:hypothetical protein